MSPRTLLAAPLLALLACGAPSPPPPLASGAAPASLPPVAPVGHVAAIVGAPDRSEKDRELDPGRHPAEFLDFLDVKPGMRIAEIGAGPGYTSELLVRATGPAGVVYMQNEPTWLPFLSEGLQERFTHAAMKGANVVRADRPFEDPLPPEAKELDLIVMNIIYHDIVNTKTDRARMNHLFFEALKPGGAYVVVDSSAIAGSGLAATGTLHRIDEGVVKKEITAAGFRLAAEGDFLRNKEDARDWNSSPGAATKAGMRGKSDRFALRFVRP